MWVGAFTRGGYWLLCARVLLLARSTQCPLACARSLRRGSKARGRLLLLWLSGPFPPFCRNRSVLGFVLSLTAPSSTPTFCFNLLLLVVVLVVP